MYKMIMRSYNKDSILYQEKVTRSKNLKPLLTIKNNCLKDILNNPFYKIYNITNGKMILRIDFKDNTIYKIEITKEN